MTVTIKEIAKIANISRGTVDRALNDRPGVNKDVADRVRKIATELGYRPNIVAKALATRMKPTVIGVIINSIGNPFFDKVIYGIKAAAAEIEDFGITVNIQLVEGYDPSVQAQMIRELERSGADAIAITPVSDPLIRDALNHAIHSGIHIICFNLDIPEVDYLAYVGCDYYKSGQTAGGMIGLVTGGCAQLGIVSGSNQIYCHGLRVDGCFDVLQKEFPDVKVVAVVDTADNNEIAYRKTKQLLEQHTQIDALFFSAAGTEGGLKAVHDLGLAGKIRIITFDLTPAVIENLRNGAIVATICQRPYDQGYQSVKILFDRVLNDVIPAETHLYTELTIRTKYNI